MTETLILPKDIRKPLAGFLTYPEGVDTPDPFTPAGPNTLGERLWPVTCDKVFQTTGKCVCGHSSGRHSAKGVCRSCPCENHAPQLVRKVRVGFTYQNPWAAGWAVGAGEQIANHPHRNKAARRKARQKGARR